MFSSFYPRPQSYYQPSAYHHPSAYYQPSAYARALAQQQEQERARARAIAQQQEEQRARAYWQEMERQRMARSRYLPEDDEDDNYYLTPRQRALLEARRRQEALEQRRLAAARLAHENALKQQQQARAAEKESTPPRRSVSPPATERASPSPKPVSPAPQPSSPSPSPERLEEAATKIQTQYRIHRALRAISALAAEFDALKSSFVPPTTIDYQGSDGAVVSLPVPASPNAPSSDGDAGAKLAFTPTNVPLHTYTELLSRLLVRLDAVESRGDRKVRERRRGVVRAVEAEAARVEAFWRGVWAAAQQEEKQEKEQEEGVKADEEEEVAAMVVDEETAAPLPELAAPESEDSELDSDFSTPPASPVVSPELVLPPESESESAEDGVVVDMLAAEEKVPADDFVLV